jgi:phosphoribosylglycinamide formyltransferase 1
MDTMTKIAVLSSSEGLYFQSLIEAKKSNRLKAEIVCLITDKADCGAAQKARAASIRVYYFDAREVDPVVYDEQVAATLDFFKVDRVLLDGYGRPLTDTLGKKIEGQLVRLDSEESVARLIQRIA